MRHVIRSKCVIHHHLSLFSSKTIPTSTTARQHGLISNNTNTIQRCMGTTTTIDSSNYAQKKTQQRQRQRPTVHLSSAPKSKFKGKTIGSSHPIVPHDISPRRIITNPNIELPFYADSGANISSPSYLSDDVLIDASTLRYDHSSIKKMRHASHLAKNILSLAFSLAKPKTTTDEIDAIIHDEIISAGAYPSFLNYHNGFPKSLCSSINEVICFGIPDSRELRGGDLISLNVGVYLDGVHGDACSSFVVPDYDHCGSLAGNMSDEKHVSKGNENAQQALMDNEYEAEELDPEQNDLSMQRRARNLISATEEALDAAIKMCYPGNCIMDLTTVIQHVAKMHGYTSPSKIDFGQGIGKELQCFSTKVKKQQQQQQQQQHSINAIKLEPGMIFTIGALLCEGHSANALWMNGWTRSVVDGGLTAHFKHTVLVTETGPDILTK